MDSESVITLGHKAKEPLIWSPSELSYGLEPHDLFLRCPGACCCMTAVQGVGEVYPGVVPAGCTGRVAIPGTNPAPGLEAYLRNIKRYSSQTAV